MQEFEQVYQQYFTKVYRFLLGITGNEHIADELTQETFLRALLNKATYREQGHMLTWLCTIAKSLWLKECRRHRFDAMPEEETPDPSPTPEQQILQREQSFALQQALLELPEEYRDVVLLHIYAEIPLKEIAARKGKSESWGKVTFYRAKQQLRRRMEEIT